MVASLLCYFLQGWPCSVGVSLAQVGGRGFTAQGLCLGFPSQVLLASQRGLSVVLWLELNAQGSRMLGRWIALPVPRCLPCIALPVSAGWASSALTTGGGFAETRPFCVVGASTQGAHAYPRVSRCAGGLYLVAYTHRDE